MDCQFKRVDVWHMVSGGTTICWEMVDTVRWPSPLHFYVDFGQPATDEWTALSATPVVDDCCTVDTCQRTWAMFATYYYRVRCILPDGTVLKSQPTPANGRLDRKDWLIAREIVRKEHLQQRKVDGTSGFLLVRKKFGVACTACQEWDTREVTDSNCAICYGTGIVGGYYPGVLQYMTLGGKWQRRITNATPPRGTNSDITEAGRCVLYPRIDTYDVWVRADSDQRYIIDSYEVAAQMKGLPLVAIAQLRLAPASDVVYSVPLEGVTSSSSSQPAVPEVRQGLTSEYTDW